MIIARYFQAVKPNTPQAIAGLNCCAWTVSFADRLGSGSLANPFDDNTNEPPLDTVGFLTAYSKSRHIRSQSSFSSPSARPLYGRCPLRKDKGEPIFVYSRCSPKVNSKCASRFASLRSTLRATKSIGIINVFGE